jgi:hypothetical protein
MTDVGLNQFGARSFDFAPVLSDESTGASLRMTIKGRRNRELRMDEFVK